MLQAYMSLLPYANLSGPTTWAPAIYKALDIVKRNNGRYHVLVIISDGQVSLPVSHVHLAAVRRHNSGVLVTFSGIPYCSATGVPVGHDC